MTVGQHARLDERREFCGFANDLVERGDVGFARLFELRDVLRGSCNFELAFHGAKD